MKAIFRRISQEGKIYIKWEFPRKWSRMRRSKAEAGNVSDVQAISGPEELKGEAVRVIKKSGKWEPALQNGRHVRSYKKQPILVTVVGQGD